MPRPRTTLEYDKLLTPGEMAAAWRVTPKTITRWADAGHVTVKYTPGGHRRYLASETPAARGQAPGGAS